MSVKATDAPVLWAEILRCLDRAAIQLNQYMDESMADAVSIAAKMLREYNLKPSSTDILVIAALAGIDEEQLLDSFCTEGMSCYDEDTIE